MMGKYFNELRLKLVDTGIPYTYESFVPDSVLKEVIESRYSEVTKEDAFEINDLVMKCNVTALLIFNFIKEENEEEYRLYGDKMNFNNHILKYCKRKGVSFLTVLKTGEMLQKFDAYIKSVDPDREELLKWGFNNVISDKAFRNMNFNMNFNMKFGNTIRK